MGCPAVPLAVPVLQFPVPVPPHRTPYHSQPPSPHSLYLVLLLQGAQLVLHFVQELGALEAAASSIAFDHHSPMAADKHRLPCHLKLLSHALAAGGAVPANDMASWALPCLARGPGWGRDWTP